MPSRVKVEEVALREAEALWRKYQREYVDSLLGQNHELIGPGERPATPKTLLKARRVLDAGDTASAVEGFGRFAV